MTKLLPVIEIGSMRDDRVMTSYVQFSSALVFRNLLQIPSFEVI
jgi:hypothetical protein